MRSTLWATAAVTALLATGAVVAADLTLRGTESTTELDQFSSTVVDGTPELSKSVVAGRIQSKFHPLPWIGADIRDVTCPTSLRAAAGQQMTCVGVGDGTPVDIPVTVVSVTPDATKVTWNFAR